MTAIKRFWYSLFDIRPGERRKTLFMALYLMLVLFAYYILKPVSRAMFLNNFDIDKLPWLYILIAVIGGLLAYLYTKMAIHQSLRRAVDFANVFCVAMLVLFWWLTQLGKPWVIYGFNIWVSLFSIMLVSQGWLVAANVFSPREAKRLYGILGVGSVLGAAFGGQFTAEMVYLVGTRHLLLASAGMVVLSYVAFRLAIWAAGKSLREAKGAEEEEDFSFNEITSAIRHTRHLQVIVAIITITFIVDVLVEFQFSAMAKERYAGRDLTAFLGNFYGFWLNLVTFVLQLFLTSFVVSRFGVGGTLQIMPVAIAAASVASLLAGNLLSAAAARITEASTRYSFNKTGTELLYLPLPLELRNRTKAFVDVFVDRMARGVGGMLLLVLNAFLDLDTHHFAAIVLVFAAIWIFLSVVAKREYLATIRKKLESRRLDLETARVAAPGREVVGLLERTAREGQPRQAIYALALLGESNTFDVGPLAGELAGSKDADIRAKAFEVLRERGDGRGREAAMAEIRNARGRDRSAVMEAVPYALATAPDAADLGRRLLDHANPDVRISAMRWLAGSQQTIEAVVDPARLRSYSQSLDPLQRRLAAIAAGGLRNAAPALLNTLVLDADDDVAVEAIATAARLQDREALAPLIERLSSPRLRGPAIQALAAFGPRVTGTLADLMNDNNAPMTTRRNIPRVLARIPDQKSADILLAALRTDHLPLRGSVLKALNKLRERAPGLNYDAGWFLDQVREEARTYLETFTALSTLREQSSGPVTALLIRTLENRLRENLERVFRLVGLKYPPRQIYAAYVAVDRGSGDEYTAALEFLDNVLERELKRVLLPLLDEDSVLAQRAQELFRIEKMTAVEAVRELIGSGDPWLASCAIAAAAELQIREVTADIRRAQEGDEEIALVARKAEAALA